MPGTYELPMQIYRYVCIRGSVPSRITKKNHAKLRLSIMTIPSEGVSNACVIINNSVQFYRHISETY